LRRSLLLVLVTPAHDNVMKAFRVGWWYTATRSSSVFALLGEQKKMLLSWFYSLVNVD